MLLACSQDGTICTDRVHLLSFARAVPYPGNDVIVLLPGHVDPDEIGGGCALVIGNLQLEDQYAGDASRHKR